MRPEDLRIGNWVIDDEGRSLKIVSITQDYDAFLEEIFYMIELDAPDSIHEIGIDEVQPIPLTEEWPKKFNWNRVGEDVWTKDYGLWTYQLEKHPGNPNGYVLFIDVPEVATPPAYHVDYVHQWQNIIHALTGEEL